MSETVPARVKFDIAAQIRCVQREINQRKRVYPRLVQTRRMTAEDANRETLTMEAVLDTLREIAGMPSAVQPGLL